MSGTSVDGVDAVLASFEPRFELHSALTQPFPAGLRTEILALNEVGDNELHRAAMASNALAAAYADAVGVLLEKSPSLIESVHAIGCHGQTVRHSPANGYSLQLGNAALLAELTNIPVVADFRNADIAAGGQGAPLVPAFHAALFQHGAIHRAVVNIGGIANITDLAPNAPARGFDCGPGNALLDAWIERHQGTRFDHDGTWARQGRVMEELLERLLEHPFFRQKPPKSTGRDDFHMPWVLSMLDARCAPADVQATLAALTVRTIRDALHSYCPEAREIYVCGGGVHNSVLMDGLREVLSPRLVETTAKLGLDPDAVEAAAFAWLAYQRLQLKPGTLPNITGARRPTVLGALYPAARSSSGT